MKFKFLNKTLDKKINIKA